jgi:outer membrane protein assembly factor BamB
MMVGLIASLAACSDPTVPRDPSAPVTISLGAPSTVPLLAASSSHIYTLRGVNETSIAVEGRSLDGRARWKRTLPSCQDACFLAADSLNNVYLTTATEIVSLTGANGGTRWSAPVRGAVVAIGSSGRVYAASRPFAVPQRLYALDAASGDILWATSVLPSLDATAILVDETRSFVYALGRGRVSTLNLQNGVVQRTSMDDCFGGSQGALAADGTIYVTCDGTSSSRLTALQPGGVVKWSIPLGSSNGTSAPVIDAAGTIYVANRTSLTALTPAGPQAWRLDGLFDNTVSPAVGSNNDVYINASQTSSGPRSILVVNGGSIVEDKGQIQCGLAFLLTPTGRVYCGASGSFVYFQGRSTDATAQWAQLGRDAQRGSRRP